MAKRKRARRTRGYFKKLRSFSRKSKYSGMFTTIFGSGVYGAGREYLSNKLMPLTSKLPLGNISDEVGLGITAILAKKFLGRKIPMLNKVADAALVVESARIGETLVKGQTGLFSSSAVASNEVTVYG